MNSCLFSVVFICVILLYSANGHKRVECTKGQMKKIDCNDCSCGNGKWDCTTNHCSPRQQCVSGQIQVSDCNTCNCLNGKWQCTKRRCTPKPRIPRGAPVAADLKNTPCAPNDYFKIDCNTCYCNIEKTGYLCTENLCSFTESSSTESSSNDTLLFNQTTPKNPAVDISQSETITLNVTVISLVGSNDTSTSLSNASTNNNHLELKPVTAINLNVTESLGGNHSTLIGDTNGGGTSRNVSSL